MLHVKCRRCAACLRARALDWAARARTELGIAQRSWFGTLTLRPDEHYKALCRATVSYEPDFVKSGRDAAGNLLPEGEWRATEFAELSDADVLRERHEQIGPELQRWLKRVRERSGGTFRYCLVMEAHKSGLPHYHILLHEVRGSAPVRYADLTETWALGFSKFKLVEADDGTTGEARRINAAGAASYVCKYLSKDALARVRASARYGKTV